MVLGCIGYLISLESNTLCIIIFLIIVLPFFFTLEYKRFFVINICFLLMGLMCFNLYFNVSLGNDEWVRVSEKKRSCFIASYKGRKIILQGNTKSLKEGMKIKVKGNYLENRDYEKGIIGKYYIKDYETKEKDLIYSMYKFKENLYRSYTNILGKEKSSIIMALCCGDSKYISYDKKKDYTKLGIVHVLCVSGFHISIVYRLLEKVFHKKLGAVFTFLYVIFTGCKASAIRAYIMIVLFRFSKSLYRNYDSLSALSLAAIILIFIRPYYILDIGFNLSFLATLGIILYHKKISRYLYKLPKFLNESISISLSAQAFSLPYIAFTLKDISLGFLLGNVFLVPIYSMAIVVGNISMLFLPISKIFNGFCYVLYTIFLSIDGGNKLLLSLPMPMAEYNYFYGVAILFLYLHFKLLKNSMEHEISI